MQGKRIDYCKVRIEVLNFVSWRKIVHGTRECYLVIPIKVSSRVKNHHFSKFAIFRLLNRAHQELSCKKIPGKNVFSVQTYGVQKFFLC